MWSLRKLLNFSLVTLSAGLLCGCAAAIIAAGLGGGVFAYSKGKLTRDYRADYRNTIKASKEALRSMKMPIKEQTVKNSQTTIFSETSDSRPVTIEVAGINAGLTAVGIRTGNVGLFDKDTSYQIHDRILKQLNALKRDAIQPEAIAPHAVPGSGSKITAPDSSDKPPPKLRPRWPDYLTVHFDSNSNKLSKAATDKLDIIVANLKNRKDFRLVLKGYTDSTGTDRYNQLISTNRSVVVKMYLVGKGIHPDKIEIIGYGAVDFIAFNNSAEGRRLNRRVEIYFRVIR